MGKTKIDWCTHTLNPVIGCTYGCPYCYARKMNTRFGWVNDFSKPQFFPERLKMLESKIPKIIFMDSMSDIADWKEEWVEKVFDVMDDNPQHQYLFLTKRPLIKAFNTLPIDKALHGNWWFGTSINTDNDVWRVAHLMTAFYRNIFLSIEPIMGEITFPIRSESWVIIGAETGNRKGKIIPRREWIENIVNQCRKSNIPVFMKSSLAKIWEEELIQEYPVEMKNIIKGETK